MLTKPSQLLSVKRDAVSAERSRPFLLLVRAGFVTRSLTYAVIGGIAMALALGAGSAARCWWPSPVAS
jgi:hypothetical protein